MSTLKDKMVKGFAWNSINVMVSQVLSLGIHIVLARLLVPEHFGLIGMISIFTELALRIQGAGLGESIIRKDRVCQEEYNFVFFYGLLVGIGSFALFFFLAPAISRFYGEPQLVWIIRCLTFNLILVPVRAMNRVQLIKKLDFKSVATVETATSFMAGVIAIVCATKGYGVWSLVVQSLSHHLISTVLFHLFNPWHPTFSLNSRLSKALFSMGSKLMVANFLQIGFRDIYNVIIGKRYTATELGFYTQGLKLQFVPSKAVNAMIKNVSFPAFASVRKDPEAYKNAFGKTMHLLTFINLPLLICLAAVADPLIPFVFSEKWQASVPFFRILIVLGLLEPIKAQYGNILKVEGRAGLLIRYVLYTKLLYLAGILIAAGFEDIYILVASQAAAAVLELFIFSHIGTHIGYNRADFLTDCLPNLGIALFTGGVLFSMNHLIPASASLLLLLDVLAACACIIILSLVTRNPSFLAVHQEIAKRLWKDPPQK